MEFSRDSALLATAGADKAVRIWDTASWRVLHMLQGGSAFTRALAFSEDRALLAASELEHIVIYQIESGRRLARWPLPPSEFGAGLLRFNRDGSRLTAVLWNEESGESQVIEWVLGGDVETLVTLNEVVISIGFMANGKLRAETYDANPARRGYHVRELYTNEQLHSLDLRPYPAGGVPVSSDNGELIALGNRCFASEVQVISVSGSLIFTDPTPPRATPILTFSPDSSVIAIARRTLGETDCRLELLSARDCRVRRSFSGLKDVDRLIFSPVGNILAATSIADYSAHFWRVSDCQKVGMAAPHGGACIISPDGRWFTSAQGALRVTDLRFLEGQRYWQA
jgi:WD40 repeat protein